jgi:hypothetical protein
MYKYCRISLISPLPRLQAWLGMGLLILSILTTQWLGLVHSIHHEPSKPLVEQSLASAHASCADHDHSLFSFLDHKDGSIQCQLFDALTLAGWISGSAISVAIPQLFKHVYIGFVQKSNQSVVKQPYQSRAPPPSGL